jgi:hypothetical protein
MRFFAALVVLALAGCGGSGPPSSVVPADATLYVGTSAAEAEQLLAAGSRDVDFEREVRPWLGERAAYFTHGSADQYGLVFAAEDEDAAKEFGERVALLGPLRASAVIDGHLVLASSRELLQAANAAAGGQSLADSTRLDVSGEDGHDLLFAAAEPDDFAAGLERFDLLPQDLRLPPLGDGPFSARARGDVVEIRGLPQRPAGPSLADLSGATTRALSSADLPVELEHQRLMPGRGLATVLAHARAGTYAAEGATRRIAAELEDVGAARRAARGLDRRVFAVRIGGGRVVVVIRGPGRDTTEQLGDTDRYREAESRLGGPPTYLSDVTAAREAGGVLRTDRRSAP